MEHGAGLAYLLDLNGGVLVCRRWPRETATTAAAAAAGRDDRSPWPVVAVSRLNEKETPKNGDLLKQPGRQTGSQQGRRGILHELLWWMNDYHVDREFFSA